MMNPSPKVEAVRRSLDSTLAALRDFREVIADKPFPALHVETELAIVNLTEAADFDGVLPS